SGAIDKQALADAAILGMLGSLDRNSQYMSPPEWRAGGSGSGVPQVGGIGPNVTKLGSVVKVGRPIEGGPAERAGIVAGDAITAVDGAPVAGDSRQVSRPCWFQSHPDGARRPAPRTDQHHDAPRDHS